MSGTSPTEPNSLYKKYSGKPGYGNAGAAGTHGTGPDYEPSLEMVGDTRSAVLRKAGVRLNCYLNAEGVGVTVIGGPQGHGTIVLLPAECDTLEEVLPHIQLKLDLDKRLMYASELWLPDGSEILAMQQLVDASAIDTPIIVGCGEVRTAALHAHCPLTPHPLCSALLTIYSQPAR